MLKEIDINKLTQDEYAALLDAIIKKTTTYEGGQLSERGIANIEKWVNENIKNDKSVYVDLCISHFNNSVDEAALFEGNISLTLSADYTYSGMTETIVLRADSFIFSIFEKDNN